MGLLPSSGIADRGCFGFAQGRLSTPLPLIRTSDGFVLRTNVDPP